MRSIIVVTSWWSNCLALICLYRLREFAPRRKIYVIQAGKSKAQMDRFREFLPEDVTEIAYPDYVAPDDSAMREYLAKEAFRDQEGAWFFDHDAFLLEPSGHFFKEADARFADSSLCLCTRRPFHGSGVTQPAYWLSPKRWPVGLSSFAPVPFQHRPYSLRPDLHRHDGKLTIPGKDTLVQVREELETLNMAGTYPLEDDDDGHHFLSFFPQHIHIGGLHLYTGPTRPPAGMPDAFFDWRRHTLMSFDAFFGACPSKWMSIEEPELLRRHDEMMRELRCESSHKKSGTDELSNGNPPATFEAQGSHRLARIKPYKAMTPEHSISRIRNRLASLDLSFVEEAIKGEAGAFSYCLRLEDRVRGEPVFQTIGKGRTDSYAKASAYGEMIERIQNLALYMILMYPSEPETGCSSRNMPFRYYPDEKPLVGKELRSGICRLFRNGSALDDFLLSAPSIGVPFWNVFGSKIEYLPFRAFQVIVGSNGMCSGNTQAESLIHGICEVFERYVMKQLFLSPCCPPDVPIEFFAGHDIHNDLNRLTMSKEYSVQVKDCSLGLRLPVLGLLIRDRNGRRYAFHLGADASPVTALERCLTEMCQGGHILFKDISELDDASGHVQTSEFWREQLHLNIRRYEGHWPSAILHEKPEYPFEGFEHPVSVSDENDLRYVLGIVENAGWDLLIRDNSFLGLPSYHVYIPGISEMANVMSDLFVRLYLAFDQKLHVITNPLDATSSEREEAVQAIEQYASAAPSRQFRAAEYLMHYRQHPLASLSHESLKEFLLQPMELNRALNVPACFKCETCWCANHCGYSFIAAFWTKLKHEMVLSVWNQSKLGKIRQRRNG